MTENTRGTALEQITEKFQQFRSTNGKGPLQPIEDKAFHHFSEMGIPTMRNEEWKYTRISGVFNKAYQFTPGKGADSLSAEEFNACRLPGHEVANELVFVNGAFMPERSTVRSSEILVMSLEEAAKNEFSEIVSKHLGNSGKYVKDGLYSLNTSFLHGGVFIHIKKGQVTEHPVYIYHITDARSANILSQPRCLVHVSERAEVHMVENYLTIGNADSFTNQVMEVIVEEGANIGYYKIQNDKVQSSQVSTTHFRQVGKSMIHAVTISLNGGIVRNNLNIALEAEYSEAHLYGLYFQNGSSHVDNHTIVDHVSPHCQSNELYKGILNDNASAVFNGKIFVRQPAQKTNAYQHNKNILLSDNASVNTKPQLEIFADDVKCSHGCTIGQLDEEGMFYLRSRGIPERIARSLLVHAFAIDILEHIRLEPLRQYVDRLISKRLEFDQL